jgi:N-acetylglucosamine kinase-like BadF-type ATPase
VGYVIGIDGGGSTVRVVVVSSDLTVCGESQGTTSNPNVVGRAMAMKTIQTAVREAVANAHLQFEQIAGVGIGIGGAEAWHSEAWVREVVAGVLPGVPTAPSSDHEIALVGAHAERRGMLVLAGTGSLACGVGSSGKYILIGGQGYLLGDEGSGYWIGMEGLRAVMRADDGRARATGLSGVMLNELDVDSVQAVIPWLYHADYTRTREVAALARLVLEQAEQGDTVASQIVDRAVDELTLAVRALNFQLDMESLPIAFVGGLIASPNPLSMRLCQRFGLDSIPLPKYPATIGAAIMALRLIGER